MIIAAVSSHGLALTQAVKMKVARRFIIMRTANGMISDVQALDRWLMQFATRHQPRIALLLTLIHFYCNARMSLVQMAKNWMMCRVRFLDWRQEWTVSTLPLPH